MNSFFDKKQNTQCVSLFDEDTVRALYDYFRHTHPGNRTNSIRSIDKHLSQLCKTKNPGTVKRVAMWWIENVDTPYVPQANNIKGFCIKFNAIYRGYDSLADKELDEMGKEVCRRVSGLSLIPLQSETRNAIQSSCDYLCKIREHWMRSVSDNHLRRVLLQGVIPDVEALATQWCSSALRRGGSDLRISQTNQRFRNWILTTATHLGGHPDEVLQVLQHLPANGEGDTEEVQQ